MVEELVNYADLILAIGVIIGGAWSLYRGKLHDLVVNIQRIEDIESKQDDMADGIVALAHAHQSTTLQVDPEALERDLRDDDEGPGRYTNGPLYRGSEDEHEESPPPGARLPEVDEP